MKRIIGWRLATFLSLGIGARAQVVEFTNGDHCSSSFWSQEFDSSEARWLGSGGGAPERLEGAAPGVLTVGAMSFLVDRNEDPS